MNIIKFLFFLIILGLLGLIGYQNQDYFLATTALTIDFKVNAIRYTAYPLPNYAYWGICFAIGLFYMGFRGIIASFRLKRGIRQRESRIEELRGNIADLTRRLEVFTHDPYIKNKLARDKAADATALAREAGPEAGPDTPDTPDAADGNGEHPAAANGGQASPEKQEG